MKKPTDSTFIDLRTDFGFKRLFGSSERAWILRQFLNILFAKEFEVSEVTFHDKEVLPPGPDGKRIVYDVYCTTDTGHHMVIEMQQQDHTLFGKRISNQNSNQNYWFFVFSE